MRLVGQLWQAGGCACPPVVLRVAALRWWLHKEALRPLASPSGRREEPAEGWRLQNAHARREPPVLLPRRPAARSVESCQRQRDAHPAA